MPDASYGFPDSVGLSVPQIGRIAKAINFAKDKVVFINQSRTGLYEKREEV